MSKEQHIFTTKCSLIKWWHSNWLLCYLTHAYIQPVFHRLSWLQIDMVQILTESYICWIRYLINRHQLMRLFSVKWGKIRRLKIVIERERTSKHLWLVETLSVNSLVDIYEKEMTGFDLAEIESSTSGNQMSKGTWRSWIRASKYKSYTYDQQDATM
jgi:hypothetical protein